MANIHTNTRAQNMTFWEKIYLPEIAKGLALTFKQIFEPKITRSYPEERFEPTGSYRGRPVLVLEELVLLPIQVAVVAVVSTELALVMAVQELSM
jgi:NADH-quinone oxidoreductase subunit I